MSYAATLKVFALVLTLVCIGLMAVMAHYTPAHSAGVVTPRAVRVRVPASRWPEFLLRGGVVCLLVSFAVLAITCTLIAAE